MVHLFEQINSCKSLWVASSEGLSSHCTFSPAELWAQLLVFCVVQPGIIRTTERELLMCQQAWTHKKCSCCSPILLGNRDNALLAVGGCSLLAITWFSPSREGTEARMNCKATGIFLLIEWFLSLFFLSWKFVLSVAIVVIFLKYNLCGFAAGLFADYANRQISKEQHLNFIKCLGSVPVYCRFFSHFNNWFFKGTWKTWIQQFH